MEKQNKKRTTGSMTVAPILIENIFFILEASGLSSWLPPFIERKGSVGGGVPEVYYVGSGRCHIWVDSSEKEYGYGKGVMIMSLEVAYRRRGTSALVPYNGMRRRDEGWASGSRSESGSERGRGRGGVSHGTEAR